MQQKYVALYLQDDYKLTPKLTLTPGLRYEFESPLTERFDRTVAGFDFAVASPIEAAARAAYAKSPIPQVPVDQFQVRGGLLFAGAGGVARTFWNANSGHLMPRIGLVYSPRPTTVVRTGYGVFFDMLGTKYQAIQSGFSQSTPVVASLDSGVTYVASLADPLPNGLLPALGAKGGIATNLGQGVTFFPPKMTPSYAQRWSFGLQQQFLREFVVDASYVGNRGTRLALSRESNPTPRSYYSTLPYRDQPTIDFLSAQVPNPFAGLLSGTGLNGANTSRSQLLRPYPEFTGISGVQPQGYSWYHALQVRGEKRFSHGYTLNVAYTWSKFMDATGLLNNTDPVPERVLSSLDFPHRLVVSGIYELPFGKGRRFASRAPGPLEVLIGGWQFNAVITFQSGAPLGFGNSIFNGNLHDISLPSDRRSVDQWFNVNAGFERSSSKQLGSNIRTLPSRFACVRNDGQNVWDFSALKNFALTERLKLQFRGEAYNAINHPDFSSPNTSPTSSSFGRTTGQNGNPRWWQLSLRLSF